MMKFVRMLVAIGIVLPMYTLSASADGQWKFLHLYARETELTAVRLGAALFGGPPSSPLKEKATVAVDLTCHIVKPSWDPRNWSGTNRLTLDLDVHWPRSQEGALSKFDLRAMPIEGMEQLNHKLEHKEQLALRINGALVDRSEWTYDFSGDHPSDVMHTLINMTEASLFMSLNRDAVASLLRTASSSLTFDISGGKLDVSIEDKRNEIPAFIDQCK